MVSKVPREYLESLTVRELEDLLERKKLSRPLADLLKERERLRLELRRLENEIEQIERDGSAGNASTSTGIGSLGSFMLRGQTYYQSEVYSRAFNLDVGRQDAFTRSSLQARFDAGSERWYLVAGVNNIEDEAVIANIAITGTGRILTNVGPPRTWYVGFGFQWEKT